MMQGEGNSKIHQNTNSNVKQISQSSLLDLHPNESPNLSLTQPIFSGDNFELWVDAVRTGLDDKNKLSFVEGTVKKPLVEEGEEESLEAVAWQQCNAMINHAATTAESEAQKLEFTQEEMVQLRGLLSNKSNGNAKQAGMNNYCFANWLLDSGASHHMTGQRNLLNNVWTGKTSIVGLPDGSCIKAQERGSVVLKENFILKDVLYVPSLTCDLISIQQLIRENNCIVTFYADHCVIQDQSTRMKIGKGEHRDGVYYFKGEKGDTVTRTSLNGDARLWHKRLGHPSSSILPLFSNLIGFKLSWNASDICDPCCRAKQTRSVFNLNNK